MLGINLNTKPKFLEEAIKQAVEIGAEALQVFVRDPTMLSQLPKSSDEYNQKIAKQLEAADIPINIHAPYVVNLSRNFEENQSALKSIFSEIEFLENILKKTSKEYLSRYKFGVVIHLGKIRHKGLLMEMKDALRNQTLFIEAMSKMMDKHQITHTKFLLETSSGQGSEILYNLIDYFNYYHSLTTPVKKNVKLCIDTCHIYVAGNELLIDPNLINKAVEKNVEKQWKLIEKNKEAIWLIHFNDALMEFGSKIDRHADFGTGKIYPEQLLKFYKFGVDNQIALIIEKNTRNGSIFDYRDLILKIRSI
jgi:deoxyribonuclease-4